MSSKRSAGWGPYVFTQSAYAEQREAELKHGVWIVVELTTTFQKGVYKLTVRSSPLSEYDHRLKHSVSDTFPSSHAQSFEALLYQQMYKLCRMLDEAAADEARQRAPKQGAGWRA